MGLISEVKQSHVRTKFGGANFYLQRSMGAFLTLVLHIHILSRHREACGEACRSSGLQRVPCQEGEAFTSLPRYLGR